MKDAAASGISYDSIDRAGKPVVYESNARLAYILTSPNDDNDALLHFFQGIWPSDVQAYGEMAARICKDEHVFHANIFVGRLLSLFPWQGKRRLVPTLAYQLAASSYAPEELKIEILRALFLEPDIPQHNLTTQFEKLIVHPLQSAHSARGSLPPVVFVLDSVHNIDCDSVMNVVTEFVEALVRLRKAGVNAKAVITGVGYRSIIKMLLADKYDKSITRVLPIPLTNPHSFLSIVRATCLPVLDWMYSQSWPVQITIGICLLMFLGLSTLVVEFFFCLTAAASIFTLPIPINLLGFLAAIYLVVYTYSGSSSWIERNVVEFLLIRRFNY